MKRGNRVAIVATLAVLLLPGLSWAQDESSNRDLLIEKLERVQLNLAPQDPSKTAVTLRLADLLAERARVLAMKDLESGCTVCTAGSSDRKKALALYREVVAKAGDANKGKVLIQVGHLHQLEGNQDEALKYYNQVIREVPAPLTQAEASLAIAEIQFKQRRFQEAAASYAKVLSTPGAGSKGLAAYRSAWCHFNMGDLEKSVAGLRTILKTPELLTRTGSAQATADVQFQEEVSRDLSTFMARRPVRDEEMKELEALSPEKAKIANLLNVGQEASRLGRNQDAVLALNFVFERMSSPADRLQVLALRTQLKFGLGQIAEAAQDYDLALTLWGQNSGCGSVDCTEPQRLLRRFVTEWNKIEKTKPTAGLVTAYEKFVSIFPEDVEMALWGAQVARQLGDTAKAENFFLVALRSEAIKADADKRENILLTRLEFAEDSKSEDLRRRAYEDYLAQSPRQKKTFEVRYQLSHLQYEKGEYEASLQGLRTLALDQKGDAKIRKQAADLSLDALVLLKDEKRLEDWAGEYATLFPGPEGKDFALVKQKTILSRAAAVGDSDPAQSWMILANFKAQEASPEDRMKAVKNRLILAEKLKKLPEARSAADELLTLPGLTAEDKEFALSRKAWLAELSLDFGTALTTTEKMALKDMAADQRLLKLAVFAELSGAQKPYYKEYLKVAPDETLRQAVASELVRKSKTPLVELKAHQAVLQKNPELWARLHADLLEKGTPLAQVKGILADAKVRATAPGQLMWRATYLEGFQTLKNKVTSHQLQTDTQKKLGASIRARAQLLEQLEKTASEAIQLGDWTAQVVSLDLVAKENDRFYQDLLSAPMPTGLTPEEEQEYLQILSTQAAPYQVKSQQARAKVTEFWTAPGVMKELETAAKGDFPRLAAAEMTFLKDTAPTEMATALAAVTAPAGVENTKPSLESLEAARRLVRDNPFDRTAVEALLNLEKQAGHRAMVGYLESRLSNWKEAR